MNKKIINSILTKKFNDWVSSIKDEKVRKLVEENSIITGGAIVSLLLKEKPKDYDIYFTNKETTKAVAEYYVKLFKEKHKGCDVCVLDGDNIPKYLENVPKHSFMFKNLDKDRIKIIVTSKGVASDEEEILEQPFEDVYDVLDEADKIDASILEQNEKDKYRPVFLSSNAITLSNNIQLVIRFYGDAVEIHKNYDFVHCTNFWTSEDKKVILKAEALEAILAKELKYVGSKYPLCSVIRTRKFINRGWTINAGQYLKMLFQVSQLDLNNIDVLEDQLIGVDSAYFNQLIKGLRQLQESNDPEFQEKITSNNYVFSIIDKIF